MAFSELDIQMTCDYVKKFGELFFESMDKQRHRFDDLFMPDATVLWNGNEFKNLNSITSFYKKLPVSETTLNSIDGQGIMDMPFFNNRKMMIVTCCGKMKFTGKMPENFTQTFTLITDESNKNWKILNQTHRNL